MTDNTVTVTFSGAQASGKTILRKFITKELTDAGVSVTHTPTDKWQEDDTLKIVINDEIKKRRYDINNKDLANAARAFFTAEALRIANSGQRFKADRIMAAMEDLTDGQLASLANTVRKL